ncbi:MAG: hypothetical protein U0640_09315 [Phycisphaerales bacterium]
MTERTRLDDRLGARGDGGDGLLVFWDGVETTMTVRKLWAIPIFREGGG